MFISFKPRKVFITLPRKFKKFYPCFPTHTHPVSLPTMLKGFVQGPYLHKTSSFHLFTTRIALQQQFFVEDLCWKFTFPGQFFLCLITSSRRKCSLCWLELLGYLHGTPRHPHSQEQENFARYGGTLEEFLQEMFSRLEERSLGKNGVYGCWVQPLTLITP